MLTHLQPWFVQMCDFGEQQPRTRRDAALAAFTRAFAEVETQAFDMAACGTSSTVEFGETLA